mmetsp:Transcript_13170/g.11157  ORF Transcript_13170/g.11157 Transcript_13170/m.11157 type:complete len:174 (-) Transcript_13170:1307-1828(-)
MGPSGAGKSTFMNTISGRYKTNSTIKISGQVMLNDVPLEATDFFRVSSYVQQDDRLIETHTVLESVEFSVMMTTKGDTQSKQAKARKMVAEMGLNRCQNTLIGGGFVKGLSGGEKKRTSIANELVSEPSVIFLDEPTTGLDSYAAEVIVKKLKLLASRGTTVIMTIHQPNSEI